MWCGWTRQWMLLRCEKVLFHGPKGFTMLISRPVFKKFIVSNLTKGKNLFYLCPHLLFSKLLARTYSKIYSNDQAPGNNDDFMHFYFITPSNNNDFQTWLNWTVFIQKRTFLRTNVPELNELFLISLMHVLPLFSETIPVFHEEGPGRMTKMMLSRGSHFFLAGPCHHILGWKSWFSCSL